MQPFACKSPRARPVTYLPITPKTCFSYNNQCHYIGRKSGVKNGLGVLFLIKRCLIKSTLLRR